MWAILPYVTSNYCVWAKICTGNKRLSMRPLGHSMEHYLKSWNLKRPSRPEIVTQNHTILCSVKLSLVKFVVTERTKLSISLRGRFLNRVVQRLYSEGGWMNERKYEWISKWGSEYNGLKEWQRVVKLEVLEQKSVSASLFHHKFYRMA